MCHAEEALGPTRGVHFIDGSDVDAALDDAGRTYLVGHLGHPQPQLGHVGSLPTPIEVGMTRYNRTTADVPHLHEWNTDIVVVITGTYAVRILSTGETKVLSPGGTCVIEPGIAHVCVAEGGTQVLFIKTPGGNDKKVVDPDGAIREWVEDQLLRWES